MRVSESKVLRKFSESKRETERETVADEWGKIYNDKLCNLHSSQKFIGKIK